MTEAELIARLERVFRAQVKDITDPDDYEDAISDAEEELGWELPQTGTFRERWLRERSIRHMMKILVISSARKFRYDVAHLHQRYEHYKALIKTADEEFETAVEDNPQEFENVSSTQMFGFNIGAGFQYSDIGEDTTYDVNAEVPIGPSSTD